MPRPRLDLSREVGSKTKKGTTITSAHAKAVAGDNYQIEVIEDNTEEVLREMPTAINRALEAIGIKAEGDVVGYMTEKYIVDTGRLRNSITHALDAGEGAVYVGTNVEYALYVHEGTSRMAGRPFLTDPIRRHGSDYRKILEETLGNA